jgi:site-specific DNA recombinase
VVENAHEAIVDKDVFELAGQILSGRRGHKTPVEDYMLRGMAKCADCGHSMCFYQQQWRRKNGERVFNPQLSCVRYHQSRQCYFNHVSIATVEAAIFTYLGHVADGHVDTSDIHVTFPHLDSVKAEADDLRRQLEGMTVKFQRQVQAYEAGALDLADLKAARERLNAEKQAIEQHLAEVEDSLDIKAQQHIAGLKGRIRGVLDSVTNSSLSPATRRAALKSVVDHIEYSRRRDELKIVLKVG